MLKALKAFVYGDSDLLHATPLNAYQIDKARVALPKTFQKTDRPQEADIFWIPVDLGHIEAYHGGARAVAESVRRLPFWKGNERRHVAYFCSDGAEPTVLPCIMFRQSFYKDRADENVVAWPYAVEDLGDLETDDFAALPYDVSFVGSRVSSKCRAESFDSVARSTTLKHFLDDSHLHWGSVEHTEVGRKRKELFAKSMAESRMVLAARGGGLSCYRFFEAMSAGRVPVLLADDWQLPHSPLIDWDDCIIQIAERDATCAGEILAKWTGAAAIARLAVMGHEAREMWRYFLAPDVWPDMMELCVRQKLGI